MVEQATDKLEFLDLTQERAARYAQALLSFSRDAEWENWTIENLMSERPSKWDLSVVVVSNGCPVGYGICSDRETSAHVHHFVVSPECRSKGVGKLLLARLAVKALDAGFERMTLKVHTGNDRAVRFYENNSMKITGEENGLYWMSGRLSDILDAWDGKRE